MFTDSKLDLIWSEPVSYEISPSAWRMDATWASSVQTPFSWPGQELHLTAKEQGNDLSRVL